MENTYYEKLSRKRSYYFLEEFEKIRQDDADSLGARIEFLKKILAELCTQRYIIKGSRNGEKIFYDKIEHFPRKWGCNDYRKRKQGRQLGKTNKKFTKHKRFRNVTPQNLGVPLTTRQPTEFLWISGNPITHCCVPFIRIPIFTKIGQSLLCSMALPDFCENMDLDKWDMTVWYRVDRLST